jgi:phytoene desaturase
VAPAVAWCGTDAVKVVVVGAGLGGLSAAAHLVGRGHEVTILERSAAPGGRAAVVAEGGYRLDIGPTVLTMPGLLADTFAAAGADMADFVTVRPVDPMYRAVYADGSELRVWHDRARMKEEIASFAGAADAEGFDRFCAWLARLYDLEMPGFIDTNYDSVLDLARPLAPALRLVRMGAFRRLARVVGSYFGDERLRRIFSFQSMYAGLAPYEALALYAVITYMDVVEGVVVPEGGMHRMATGLATALEKAGVEIRYRSPVTRVLRGPGGAVIGVQLGAEDGGDSAGERRLADAVVCNADLPVAYRTLLGGVDAPRSARRGRYSPSCLLWVAGVRGAPPPGSAHHNIHFGTDWDQSFAALIERGTRMPDPSILVTQHSLDDPGLAPEGCSTMYVLEPEPNLDGRVDWTRERDRARTDLVSRVAALGYPVDAEVERFYDPLDWEALGMERGTPFALAHTFRQTGPFRPANVDRRVPGLVFVGSSTVPGVGVPMVLISGRLAAERVERFAAEGR